jgi:hypothetical protein
MIIDIHTHILPPWTEPKQTERLLKIADRFDIQWIATSMCRDFYIQPTPDEIRRTNDFAIGLMRRWPDRFIGFCYLNPHHGKTAIDELNRCADAGMRGIKLWIACYCDDPAVNPIVERAIELNLPVLQHTWKKTTGNMEAESEPRHLRTLALRYPQARFIMAHSGGYWEYGLKMVRDCPNITVDTSGGDPTSGLLEAALREVGPQRIAFGSDTNCRSIATQIAKVDSVKLSPRIRKMILCDNAKKLLNL